MNDKTIVGGIVVVILAVGIGLFYMSGGSGVSTTKTAGGAPEGALELAQCLVDKGVTFYGSFTCSHCIKQKKLFGSAAEKLPYVECTPATGNGQFQVCIDKKIESYPTWEFADGSRVTGEQSFGALRAKSGCALPGEATATIPAEETEAQATTDASLETKVVAPPIQ